MRIIIVIITAIVFFIGCNQNTGNKREWEIREDIVSLSLPQQVRMLQEIEPEEVFKYWRYKLENTMDSEILTPEEKKVIAPLLDEMTLAAYQDFKTLEYNAEEEALLAHSEEIVETLMSEYGWDEEKVFKYFGTIKTEQEYEESLKRGNIDCKR